jgi:hypothetical protein
MTGPDRFDWAVRFGPVISEKRTNCRCRLLAAPGDDFTARSPIHSGERGKEVRQKLLYYAGFAAAVSMPLKCKVKAGLNPCQ